MNQRRSTSSLPAHHDGLYFADTLIPHADTVLSNRMSIFGVSGYGKSNTVAVVVEEIGRFGTPLILFDTEDEYQGLCQPQFLPHACRADATTVTLANAYYVGQSMLREMRQVVLNLQSYDTDDLAALIMIEIIRGLKDWEESRASEDRVSCLVVLDEASVWLPQNERESVLSREKDKETGLSVLGQLQQTFFSTVVRRGRKRGIGFVFATQRIAEIDKRAMSSSWIMLHRQTLPPDLKLYHQYGITRHEAMSLVPGQAFVIMPGGGKEIVQLRRRSSPDKAQTPGLQSIRLHLQHARPRQEEEQEIAGSEPLPFPVHTVRRSRPQTEARAATARRLYQDPNQSIAHICAVLDISPPTLYRYVKGIRRKRRRKARLENAPGGS